MTRFRIPSVFLFSGAGDKCGGRRDAAFSQAELRANLYRGPGSAVAVMSQFCCQAAVVHADRLISRVILNPLARSAIVST